MQLSKRLQMVADCVTKGNRIADVGCDHAYISIYLIENDIASKSVALDVNEGPLARANDNIRQYHFSDRIAARLSNGLEKLEPNEADSIVIAGMGGLLMMEILKEGMACVKTAKEIILQPQSEVEKVREYLHSIDFTITKEDMCIDDGKFYVVMKAVPNAFAKNRYDMEKRVNRRYGALLLAQQHPVLHTFLEKESRTVQLIFENITKNGLKDNKERQEELKEEISLLQEALSYYKVDER